MMRFVDGEIGGGVQSDFVGQSEVHRAILETISMVAPRKCPVVITGPTGTGKEMAARQIHAHSRRSGQVFIPVDCTALSGQLFESQLFGHVKGAFTGAYSDTLGFFRAADKGTLFLDEIGEMDLELQAKLLRVLQESRVVPVGATHGFEADVRVLCATNRDLKQMVREGAFRADLYFRLNVFVIEMPPLCQRRQDIPVLAEYFLNRQAAFYDEPPKRLSAEVLEILLNYAWPGNVRELANTMEHAYIAGESDRIYPSDLPMDILLSDLQLPGTQEDDFMNFDQIQKRMILTALNRTGGRKIAAARMLKMDHRRLGRLMEEFDIRQTWKLD